MSIHTADAIVLRRYLFRETSVIVTCLTDRYGKLRGLVKGLRVHPNRHRSAMEPMTVNRIVFYDTRSSQIHLISQCELMLPLAGLQRDLPIVRAAALCLELVDTVVPLNEPQPAIYRLLRDALERLALEGQDVTTIRSHFILRLLRLAGFHPQLDECTGCSRTVQGAAFWSAREGGLLCEACLHHDPKAEPVGAEAIDLLEQYADHDTPVPLDPQIAPILAHRLDEFLRWRLDKPLKTLGPWDTGQGTRNVPQASRPMAQT